MNDEEFFSRVGRTLLAYQLISEDTRQEVDKLVREKHLEYEHALAQAGHVDPALYRRVLEEVSGCIAVDPSQITVDKDFIESMLDVLPLDLIVGLRIFPISLGGNELTLALPNPTNAELIQELEATTSLRVRPVVTTYRGVQQAVEQNYMPRLREVVRELQGLAKTDVLAKIFERKLKEDPIPHYDRFLALVNREFDSLKSDEDFAHFLVHPVVVSYTQRLLTDLILRSGSDIHMEPGADNYRVRTRINGVLRTVRELPKKCGDAVQMRIRSMAGMPLRELPAPLDGQINYSPVYGRHVEFRVSVLPTINGPKTVMRLLEKQNQNVGLEKIGLMPDDLVKVRRNIEAPNGLILVTGPTGSGKTSTLYSIVSVLNDEKTCIVTAEEPVESELPGIVQVSCGKDCTFAMALRSFLRQDPDVIMVGEIRDEETADIALRAALTGHLVLSTLHTNDAPTAVMRLLNLGVDPFVVASSLRMVIAQRLMRVLCEACKTPVKRAELLNKYSAADVPPSGDFFLGNGCERCNGSGYKGRTGIYEILEKSDDLTDAVNRRATLVDIRTIAAKGGMHTLRQRAMDLCGRGITTVEEVIRVTAE
jgi:type IV pilus assembly protein PilB